MGRLEGGSEPAAFWGVFPSDPVHRSKGANPMKGRSAFTLTELMVVMLLIALLVLLLVPALSTAIAAARDVACRSNLKQLILTQHVYSQEQNGRFTQMANLLGATSWTDRLIGYLPEASGELEPSQVFACPSAKREEMDKPGVNQRPTSTGLNGALWFEEWDYRRDEVLEPAETILLGEKVLSDLELILTTDRFGVAMIRGKARWYFAYNHVPSKAFRHGRESANKAYVDGHVEYTDGLALRREAGHWTWWKPSSSAAAMAGSSSELAHESNRRGRPAAAVSRRCPCCTALPPTRP